MALFPARSPRRVISLVGFLTLLSLLIYRGLQVKGRDGRFLLSNHDGARESPSGNIFSGESYEKMVVVARTRTEDVSWVVESFPSNGSVGTAIYTVDDPFALLHPPMNKGHEAMAYLSYIIDYYHALSPITIFMHAHRYAWHNNEVLSNDAVEMISHLSTARVLRDGYMNLRCNWQPGCPSWIQPLSATTDINKQEQSHIGQAWSELFPTLPLPTTLAQPCCAQFAVSRERILSSPQEKYISLRNWLLQTPLNDTTSGRIFEYTWQVIFQHGTAVVCPAEHICYCDGYGLCFGGRDQLDAWWDARRRQRQAEKELREWRARDAELRAAVEEGRTQDLVRLEPLADGADGVLEERIAELHVWLQAEKWKAGIRGQDPRIRAEESGMTWVVGSEG